jgi:hypothetical protein
MYNTKFKQKKISKIVIASSGRSVLHFTGFTGTKVQMQIQVQVLVLFWFAYDAVGTQFTCFTGTKVQILTRKALVGCILRHEIHGTKVQILTQKALSWYKSTNTDAEGVGREHFGA